VTRRAPIAGLLVGLAALSLSPVATGDLPGPDRGAAASLLLPDLDQQTPNQLLVARDRSHWLLGFQSAVRNIGTGPLLIHGHRPSGRVPEMTADQTIRRSDGSARVARGVGKLRYVRSPDHQHWHVLRFERYELKRADGRVMVRDHKTGFCLGDRYRSARAVASAPANPVWTGRCGLRQTRRLQIDEGISPGYGDNYIAYLEGQSLSLDGVPAGRYVLVHRVNTDRRLRESDYSNDAASVLLDLKWKGGTPRVTQLAACPDSASCSVPQPGVAPVPAGQISANWRRAGGITARVALCSLGTPARP